MAHDCSWARRGWDDGSLRLPEYILTLFDVGCLYSEYWSVLLLLRCLALSVSFDTLF